MKKHALTLLGALMIVAYFYISSIDAPKPQDENVTSFSEKAVGLSRLATALKKGGEEKVSVLGEPLLSKEQLAKTSLLVMTSVVRTVTEFEAELIEEYVSEGGTLLITYHNKETLNPVFGLLDKLSIDGTVKKNQKFRNQQLERVVAPITSGFMKAGETYGFYSPVVFSRSDCAGKNAAKSVADCFVDDRPVGLGRVVIALGIPFFANAIVGEEDNPKLAARIFSSQTNVVFDEFHHFFTSHTIIDLLMLPAFSLPLGGLVLCVILFFIYGPAHQIEPVAANLEVKTRGFHDVNVGFLWSELKNATSEAVVLQHRYLERYFPDHSESIRRSIHEARESEADTRTVFWQLGRKHSEILLSQGRRRSK